MRATNRKDAKKILLVNWSRFQNTEIVLNGSSLITGVNGSGKSTVLDALTYLLTGNTQFNKAAKDRDRTVLAYVRGDTKSEGSARYLRSGQVISYIAMEFESSEEDEYFTAGCCIESTSDADSKPSWFVLKDCRISDVNFARVENGQLFVTPKYQLNANGRILKSADFMGRDKGTEQVLRAMGLRCSVDKYKSKLLKMMAFNPENNIDKFIAECVLEPGKIESLQELREQKAHFEDIKRLYDGLQIGKKQLDYIENCTLDYEDKKLKYYSRKLMLIYQNLKEAEENKEKHEQQLKYLKQRIQVLNKNKKTAENELEKSRKRLHLAESNSDYMNMQASVNELENQLRDCNADIERYKAAVSELKTVKAKLETELSWLLNEAFDEKSEKDVLLNIDHANQNTDMLAKAFMNLSDFAELKEDALRDQKIECDRNRVSINEEIKKFEHELNMLDSNRMVFPDEVNDAVRIIRESFKARNINADVRLFAELVSDIKDKNWQKAIECFLDNKRFHIIVDGAYCLDAMRIVQEQKLHRVNVVITDKLPDIDIADGSASQQLIIHNMYARRYANYLLNGIHLCDSIEELHEYPKGGLTQDGMLAKSYSVSCMNMKNIRYCLGSGAIEMQKKQVNALLRECKKNFQELNTEFAIVSEKLQCLRSFDFRLEHYNFEAPKLLSSCRIKQTDLQMSIDKIKNDESLLSIIREQEEAKKIYDGKQEELNDISESIGRTNDSIATAERGIKDAESDIDAYEKDYISESEQYPEVNEAMLDEYDNLYSRKNTAKVIAERTVDDNRNDYEKSIRVLEDAQFEYCKTAELDINKRGAAYIPFFRKQRMELISVRIDEAKNRLDEQSQKLQTAFVNDFVAEINEAIINAKDEIRRINDELRSLPFGSDTYKFEMNPKPDRAVFFRICDKFRDYMDAPELYAGIWNSDEKFNNDMSEFMNMILEEEDEIEYTDYRRYFNYDMQIVSRQGGSEITAELSKKHGSASNGEKQTPYFIILAASLVQCYPRQSVCARLAFIDEAFSALSRERIEQMVKYLEDNNFQVIYAAPPEKINSIGSFIDSTISLVMTGRYTNAVEGLVAVNE